MKLSLSTESFEEIRGCLKSLLVDYDDYIYCQMRKLVAKKYGDDEAFSTNRRALANKLDDKEVLESILDCCPTTFKEFYANFVEEGYSVVTADKLEKYYILKMENILENAKSTNDLRNKLFYNEINLHQLKKSSVDLYKLQKCKDMKEYETVWQIFGIKFFSDSGKNIRENLDRLANYYLLNKPRLDKEISKKMKVLFNVKHSLSVLEREGSIEDIKNFYKEMQTTKLPYMEYLYDCMRYAKNDTAKKYREALTPLSNYESKIQNGVKVYNVCQNDYNMLISVTDIDRRRVQEKYLSGRSVDTISASYVTKNSLVTYKDLRENIAFGYSNFDPSLLIYVTGVDNYSTYRLGDTFFSNQAYDLRNPNDLARWSKENRKYNEINLLKARDVNYREIEKKFGKDFLDKIPELKPDFMFCLNKITNEEYLLAKRLDLPIVYVENPFYHFFGMERENEPDYDYSL